mgnify:CR=1 FL=1
MNKHYLTGAPRTRANAETLATMAENADPEMLVVPARFAARIERMMKDVKKRRKIKAYATARENNE